METENQYQGFKINTEGVAVAKEFFGDWKSWYDVVKITPLQEHENVIIFLGGECRLLVLMKNSNRFILSGRS
jgi:hypothetical protein